MGDPTQPAQGSLFDSAEPHPPGEDALRDADSRARLIAVDPTRSILLSAPAGSGKTTVLTERFLRLLTQVDEPEQILAITFTRKAAAEMRARLLALLSETKRTAKNTHEMRLHELAARVRARSALRGWSLESDPARLRIQTIDALNFSLAAQLPITAKVGGALAVGDHVEETYSRAARATLVAAETDAALVADIEVLFDRLDNDWRRVEGLIAAMLAKRAHWLPILLAHDRETRHDTLRQRIEASLRDIARGTLERIASQLSADELRDAETLPGVGVLTESDPAAGDAPWRRFAALALTGEGSWRRRVDKRAHPDFADAATRTAGAATLERLGQIRGLQQSLLALRDLPATSLSDSDAEALAALSRVLEFATAHLQVEFAVAGKVDHTFVAGAARTALVESGSPSDLALRTGLELRHILVDEFQDTSLGQLELLESLTVGWEGGDGRTLFVVGDPMQSIYQFREAEVGLFLRARDHGIGGIRLEPFRLTRNFRSHPALVAWTNDTFTLLFPTHDDIRASAVAFTPSVAGVEGTDNVASHIHLQRVIERGAGEEAAFVADRVAELRARDPGSSIAILVAARTHATSLTQAMSARGLRVRGVDLVPLAEVTVIRDLVALTRALHRREDRVAWLAVLRAPWCGVTLDTLTSLVGSDPAKILSDALHDVDVLDALSAQERCRLLRVRAELDAAAQLRSRLPLEEWIERTWIRLGGHDACDESALRQARAFFDALATHDAAGEWRGPDDLDLLLGRLFDQSPGDDRAIQVMTIHRAKGLEFDHVFVPSLGRALNRGADPLLRWLDLPREDGGSDLLMAPIRPVAEDPDDTLGRYIRRLTDARLRNEQARLLYVAATRAKQTLHLFASARSKDDETIESPRHGTLLALLWPATEAQFESVSLAAQPPDTGGVNVRTIQRLPMDWALAPIVPGPADTIRAPLSVPEGDAIGGLRFDWAGQTARHVGTVVHETLERWAKGGAIPDDQTLLADRPSLMVRLRRRGVPEGELDVAVARVESALRRTANDERGRWILDAAHLDAHSEFALSGMHEGKVVQVIIDRSFVAVDGTRWVIDFKTSAHEGGGLARFLDEQMSRYAPQMSLYTALARRLGPQPVRAALYFPLLGEFREWSGAPDSTQ